MLVTTVLSLAACVLAVPRAQFLNGKAGDPLPRAFRPGTSRPARLVRRPAEPGPKCFDNGGVEYTFGEGANLDGLTIKNAETFNFSPPFGPLLGSASAPFPFTYPATRDAIEFEFDSRMDSVTITTIDVGSNGVRVKAFSCSGRQLANVSRQRPGLGVQTIDNITVRSRRRGTINDGKICMVRVQSRRDNNSGDGFGIQKVTAECGDGSCNINTPLNNIDVITTNKLVSTKSEASDACDELGATLIDGTNRNWNRIGRAVKKCEGPHKEGLIESVIGRNAPSGSCLVFGTGANNSGGHAFTPNDTCDGSKPRPALCDISRRR